MTSIEPLDPTAKFAPVAGEPQKQPEPPAAADQGDGAKGSGSPAAPEPPAEKPEDKPADAPLGPEGEKALGIWKDRAKNAEASLSTLLNGGDDVVQQVLGFRTRATEAEAAARAAQAERDEALAKLADAGKSTEEQALAAARREGVSAATATVTSAASKALATQALIAEAKGRLADPSDAVAFLDVADFTVGADFTINATEIAEAVTGLLSRKPHLAVKTDGAATAPVVPTAGIGQGVREKDAPTVDQQIADAQQKGDMATVMALKSNQLFAALKAQPTT